MWCIGNNIKFLLFAVLVILTGCEDVTRVEFRETLNLLDIIQPPYAPTTGRRISGFELSDHPTTPTEILRFFSTGFSTRAMPAAGSESPPCNDGTPFTTTLSALAAPLVRIASFIGDTGDDDVSHDADCRCDTHIQFLELAPFILHYADGTRASFPGSRIDGRYFLCPNIPGGHHVSGDRKLDSSVNVSFSMTIRVSDDDMNLLTDVVYVVVEN